MFCLIAASKFASCVFVEESPENSEFFSTNAVWNANVSFCLQIWALAVSPTTETLATGGGDSLINLWKDCTVDDEDEAIRKEVFSTGLRKHCSCCQIYLVW